MWGMEVLTRVGGIWSDPSRKSRNRPRVCVCRGDREYHVWEKWKPGQCGVDRDEGQVQAVMGGSGKGRGACVSGVISPSITHSDRCYLPPSA